MKELEARRLLPWRVAAIAALVATAACRKDEIVHYRVPKSRPEQAMPATAAGGGGGPSAVPAGMPAGDVPPASLPEGASALRWTLPARWTESRGGSAMRYATLKAPVDGRLDVSVTVLPGPAGGELANVNRWRGQIGLPNLDEAALAAQRKPVTTKAGTISLYDFTSEGEKKSRVVAGLALVDGNTWFVKMTGEAPAVAKAHADFLRIVESLRLDAAK
jgi:hypothetical protein